MFYAKLVAFFRENNVLSARATAQATALMVEYRGREAELVAMLCAEYPCQRWWTNVTLDGSSERTAEESLNNPRASIIQAPSAVDFNSDYALTSTDENPKESPKLQGEPGASRCMPRARYMLYASGFGGAALAKMKGLFEQHKSAIVSTAVATGAGALIAGPVGAGFGLIGSVAAKSAVQRPRINISIEFEFMV
jgi:hypothetical protein